MQRSLLNYQLKINFKVLFFKEWINSGIFFVNDIIDEHGKITQEFILHKSKNKSNWISSEHFKFVFFKKFENEKTIDYLYLVFQTTLNN
jgi:hypothetical protein